MAELRGRLEYQMVRALQEIQADLTERGISASAWCRAARVDRSTLWRYMGEYRQPSPRTFDKLVSAASAITGYDITTTIMIRMGRVQVKITGP
jgi:hypothetical protein